MFLKKYAGGILTATLLVVSCGGFLTFAIREARESSRRTQCRGNCASIYLALLNYHDAYGSFPPAYTTDESGNPMHSWRILVLAVSDYLHVYRKYDFNEPWNGPNNRTLADQMPQMYRCPSHFPDGKTESHTDYVVVTGDSTAFPGSKSVNEDAITDDKFETILVVECVDSGIHWMEPRDLSLESMKFEVNSQAGPSISTLHCDAHMMLLGSYRGKLKLNASASTIRALLTIADGDEPDALEFHTKPGRSVTACETKTP